MDALKLQEMAIIGELVDLVGSLPQVQAKLLKLEPTLGNSRYDALLEAKFGDLPLQLWVEVKSNIFPRDAREQLARWRASAEVSAKTAHRHFIVAAQTISPGARQMLADEGIGYFAQGGSLCLPFTGAYTFIDKSSERKPTRDFDLFTDARTPVLEAMLLHPDLFYTVHDLAGNTGSSSATVSKLFSKLEREDWVAVEGSGPFKRRRLSNPAAVLDAWVAAQTDRLPHRKARRFFVGGHKAVDLPGFITDAMPMDAASATTRYHFTAEAAAHHYARFLTTWPFSTMRAVPQVTTQLRETVAATEVEQGYNLVVIEDGLSALKLSESDAGLSLASPVQTYVDLMCGTGRAPDAARHLREQILKF